MASEPKVIRPVDELTFTDRERELVLQSLARQVHGHNLAIQKTPHDFVKDGFRKLNHELAALRQKVERM